MTKLFINGLIFASLLVAASGCSVFKGSTTTKTVDDALAAEPTVTESPAETAAPESAAPESAAAEKSEEPAVKGSAVNVAELLEGEWYICKVGSTEIVQDEDMPYIHFETEANRFYASNGCNVLNGNYTLSSDNVITFANVLCTMQYCPEVTYDGKINAVIADGMSVTAVFTQISGDSYIDLLNDNKCLLKLRRHNLGFLNGNWQVKMVNGVKIDDEEATIFFDLEQLSIHGNTGCNYFNGEIYIDPSRTNAVDFSKMGVTRMACPKTQQETAILVALEQTNTAIAGNNDQASLRDVSGKEVLRLKRLPLTKEDE
jgi:heat shock protein HslJ